MQNTKTIPLADGGSVTVNELRVRDVRQLLSKFNDLSAIDVRDLLTDRFGEIAGLVKPLLSFSGEGSIDDLTGSEIKAVIDAAVEVNAAFLDLVGLNQLAAIRLDSSTELVAGSSNAATPASSTTAGDSSWRPLAMPTNETVNEADSGNAGQGQSQT